MFFTGIFLPNRGGAELMLHRLALYLHTQGHDVMVLAPNIDSQNCIELPYPVKRYDLPRSNKIGLRFLARHLFDAYQDFAFDVLHCHSAYTQLYAATFFAKKTGVPIISRPHGSDIFPGVHVRKSQFKERKLRWAIPKADHFIAQGQYLKRLLLDLGATEDGITCIGNAVDPDFAQYCQTHSDAENNWESNVILAMGRLEKPKGFETLIRAWAKYQRNHQILKIAGEGSDRVRLEAIVDELKLNDSVEFVGFQSGHEKMALFKAAKFLVFPSTQEGFSNTLVEACYAELPAIASDIEANKDVIVHDSEGLFFKQNEVDDLVLKMEKLNTDFVRYKQIKSALKRISYRFDMSSIGKQYLDVYSNALKKVR